MRAVLQIDPLTHFLPKAQDIIGLSTDVSVQRAFRRVQLPSSPLPLVKADERFQVPPSVSYFSVSELGVISLLITSQNPSFTPRIQSLSDYNEKIMRDRIKDRMWD